jgi:hypothetical protein
MNTNIGRLIGDKKSFIGSYMRYEIVQTLTVFARNFKLTRSELKDLLANISSDLDTIDPGLPISGSGYPTGGVTTTTAPPASSPITDAITRTTSIPESGPVVQKENPFYTKR